MGKIDIDYQKLHDAFFKWQTKPKLTIHGDLYYEVRGWGGEARGCEGRAPTVPARAPDAAERACGCWPPYPSSACVLPLLPASP